MSFDFNKWWEYMFGPAAPTEDETETEETETEDERSGPPSDASKDISSDDTVMEVNTQILDVSHRSVLARPHPPPRPVYRLPDIDFDAATADEPTEEPEYVKVEIPPVSLIPKSAAIPIESPLPMVISKQDKAIRRKPWYKRVLRRRTQEEKARAKLEEEKKKKEKAAKKRSKSPAPKKDEKGKEKKKFWQRFRSPSPAKIRDKIKDGLKKLKPSKDKEKPKVKPSKEKPKAKEKAKEKPSKEKPKEKAKAKEKDKKKEPSRDRHGHHPHGSKDHQGKNQPTRQRPMPAPAPVPKKKAKRNSNCKQQ